MAKKNENVDVSGQGLELLLNRVLEQCERDVEESEQNIAFYKSELINNPMGREQYGHLLNDALKIKGQVRERYIKIVNLFKDRVKIKEVFEKAQGSDESPENLLKAIDQYLTED